MKTQGTQLTIINRTPYGVMLKASADDSGDWDDASAPLSNVNGKSIAAYGLLSTHQELNYWCKTAPFSLTIAVSTPQGKWIEVVYNGDQYNATSNIQRRAPLLSGPGLPFTLLQNSGSGSNSLCLVEAPAMNQWMKGVGDSHSLVHMSIPGTHDSCALAVVFNARCQTVSIADQLNQGIRFLDVRCVNDNNQFSIAHGSISETATFSSVLAACREFLAANPSECIIVSVKKENPDSDSTQTFEQTFRTYIPKNPWLVNHQGQLVTALPTMAEGRGKVILLRRFNLDSTSSALPLGGIDATNWPDNQTFTNNNQVQPLAVQDQYQVEGLACIKDKWSEVESFLQKTNADSTSNTWYINFTSGSSLVAYPSAVAKGSNPFTGVSEYLFDFLVNGDPHSLTHVGTVLLDYCEFPDYGLMPVIVSFNRP